MTTPAAPLRILCTAAAAAEIAAPVAALARAHGGRPLQLLHFEQAGADADAEVALVTRDLTGLSTKHELQPATAAAYDAMRRARSLRWVHIHSAGADRPVYLELAARGVEVTPTVGANAGAVAQTALAGVLALSRRLPRLMAAQRAHRWAPLVAGDDLPPELEGQTAVVVGFGPIGRRIAALLQAFGVRVVVARHGEAPAEGAVATVGYGALASVLPQADWLLLACPLTDATRGLVDAAALARLPRHAHLVNVSRGEVVVERDLVAALQAGALAGAFLDVFEHEPLPAASPLWDLPDVIATPHTAGHFGGHHRRVVQAFLDGLARRMERQLG